MKNTFNIFAACALLTASAHVFAASTVDLTVKGLIIPAACTPTLSSNVIDHGKISASDLNPDASRATFLPKVTLQLSIDCDAAIAFALSGTDNRPNTLPTGVLGYGLGLINTDQRLGLFTLGFANPVADNASVLVLLSKDSGTTWDDHGSSPIQPGQYLGFGDWNAEVYQPIPIKNLKADMGVITMIAPTSGLDLSNEAPLDGSATLEVKYL